MAVEGLAAVAAAMVVATANLTHRRLRNYKSSYVFCGTQGGGSIVVFDVDASDGGCCCCVGLVRLDVVGCGWMWRRWRFNVGS